MTKWLKDWNSTIQFTKKILSYPNVPFPCWIVLPRSLGRAVSLIVAWYGNTVSFCNRSAQQVRSKIFFFLNGRDSSSDLLSSLLPFPVTLLLDERIPNPIPSTPSSLLLRNIFPFSIYPCFFGQIYSRFSSQSIEIFLQQTQFLVWPHFCIES